MSFVIPDTSRLVSLFYLRAHHSKFNAADDADQIRMPLVQLIIAVEEHLRHHGASLRNERMKE